MIVREILVSGWKCFAGRVRVGEFSPGVNVIYAPNGTGKSTLFDAMTRGLLDKHTSAGEDAAQLRPLGRDLAPWVQVTFEHLGAMYRVTKQFLDSASCVLERQEGGRWVPFAQADKAATAVREFLRGEAPGRGLCSAKHWGVGQLLWAPQGAMDFAEVSDTLAGHIRGTLGAQLRAASSGVLEEAIEREFEKFFTEKGRLKKGANGAPLVKWEDELAEARAARNEVAAELARFDAASGEVERLRRRVAELEGLVAQRNAEVCAAEKLLGQFEGLKTAADKKVSERKAAEQEYQNLERAVRGLADARREMEEAARNLKELEAQVPAAEEALRRVKQVAAEEEAAAAQLEKLGRAEEANERELIHDARSWAEAAREMAELGATAEKVESVRAERTRVIAERKELGLAPDAAALREIREAVAKRENARVRLETALITLTVELEEEAEGAEPLKNLQLLEGEQIKDAPIGKLGALGYGTYPEFTFQGAPEVAVRIDALGVVRARGASVSADKLREELRETEQRIVGLVGQYAGTLSDDAEFGAKEMRGLEERAEKKAGLDAELETLNGELRGLLGRFLEGKPKDLSALGPAFDDLKAAFAAAENRLTEIAGRRGDWERSAPDLNAIEGKIQKKRSERDAAAKEAQGKAKVALEYRARCEAALQGLTGSIKNEREREAGARRRSDELLRSDVLAGAAEDESTRETAWQGRLTELSMAVRALGAEVDAARKEMEDLRVGAGGMEISRGAVEKAKTLQEKLRAELVGVKEEAARTDGELRTILTRAPYSRLAEAEEKVALLEARVADEGERMDAIALLAKLARECREAAMADVLAPVQRRASEYFRRIAGERMGGVSLAGGAGGGGVFSPERVSFGAGGDGGTLEVGRLSGGEREQLWFAVRLALAEELARDERQLFLMDDALAATDAARHGIVREILREAAQDGNLQVMVLTCRPEFFEEWRGTAGEIANGNNGKHGKNEASGEDGLNARFFDLAGLIAGEGEAELAGAGAAAV